MIPGCAVEVPNLHLFVDAACSAALASEKVDRAVHLEVIGNGSGAKSLPDLDGSIWQTDVDGFRLIIRPGLSAIQGNR